LIGNDMVIFGGFKNGYNMATNETYALDLSVPNAMWRRMDDMPVPSGITHQGLVVIGTKAYLCGGYIGGSLGKNTDACYVYDHSVPARQSGGQSQWSTMAALPKGGRAGGGMIYDSTRNAIIYAGGSQRAIQGQTVAIDYQDTWMYSFSNTMAGWVPQSNIPFLANHMNSVTVVDGSGKERHYIFGGQVGDYELWGNVATMYEYIATTDTWIQRRPMPFGRGHATSSVRPLGCGFIIAGGRTNQGLTGDISYYHVANDTWQSIGQLPVDIHTNVCVISPATGMLRCETGWATGTFSTETKIIL
jgi:Kelch motif